MEESSVTCLDATDRFDAGTDTGTGTVINFEVFVGDFCSCLKLYSTNNGLTGRYFNSEYSCCAHLKNPSWYFLIEQLGGLLLTRNRVTFSFYNECQSNLHRRYRAEGRRKVMKKGDEKC